jgi:hypothetical protein
VSLLHSSQLFTKNVSHNFANLGKFVIFPPVVNFLAQGLIWGRKRIISNYAVDSSRGRGILCCHVCYRCRGSAPQCFYRAPGATSRKGRKRLIRWEARAVLVSRALGTRVRVRLCVCASVRLCILFALACFLSAVCGTRRSHAPELQALAHMPCSLHHKTLPPATAYTNHASTDTKHECLLAVT